MSLCVTRAFYNTEGTMGKTQFELFFERLSQNTVIENQLALATTLGINRSAVTQAKKRDIIPQKWILALSRKFNLSPDWLEYGREPKYLYTGKKEEKENRDSKSVEESAFFIRLPKIKNSSLAEPCTGSENEGILHTFDAAWIKRFGNINEMVLMDVTDDSMSPTLSLGDIVMVNCSSITELNSESIYVVQYNNQIIIKRLTPFQDGYCLKSDNPKYNPVTIQSNAKKYLSIIGRVVWLCRFFA